MPGAAAAAAWCSEGLLLAFLLIHLRTAGLPSGGPFGAASVFAVFAASVIVARIALARMPDRIGPLRSAVIALLLLSGSLAILAIATSFPIAAAGAAIMGIGFSPLYPSLTMLAVRGLEPGNRALGLGLFASSTGIGYASGALVGGFMLAATSSMWAFLLIAGLQLLAGAVLLVFAPRPGPSGRMGTNT